MSVFEILRVDLLSCSCRQLLYSSVDKAVHVCLVCVCVGGGGSSVCVGGGSSVCVCGGGGVERVGER